MEILQEDLLILILSRRWGISRSPDEYLEGSAANCDYDGKPTCTANRVSNFLDGVAIRCSAGITKYKPTLFADFVSFLGEVLRASPFLPLLLPSCYLPATSAALCGPLRPSAAHYQSLVALPMYQSQASLGKGFLGAFCTAAAAKLEARREGTSFSLVTIM
ncbi:hypothetical protein L208DRAFT_295786 [Tricholoma matsutake]|nr:hypothetical protein L208DRAFT_295786 [Tricholoma matsutake 945]